MTDLAVIENKISAVKKYLKIMERYGGLSALNLKNDIDQRGAAERYLYLVIQSTIDLAEAIVSFKNLRKPETMSQNFEILSEQGMIDQNLKENLVKMVGFRNIVAHDYEEMDYSIMVNVLKNGANDINNFLKIASEIV